MSPRALVDVAGPLAVAAATRVVFLNLYIDESIMNYEIWSSFWNCVE